MGEVISLARERTARRPAEVPPKVRTDKARPVAVRPEVRPDGVQPAAVRPAEDAGPRRPDTKRDPLWREVSGAVLRAERHRQGRTLADVAGRAGMSVQHLSDVERGRKEASSEMLAAATGSLGLNLAEFARRCATTLADAGTAPTGPVLLAA